MEHLRAAVVQMASYPAYVDAGRDYLAEPDPLAALAQPGSSLFRLAEQLTRHDGPHVQHVSSTVSSLQEMLRRKYEDMLQRKLMPLLSFLSAHQVNLVVFPEYSIPCRMVEVLRNHLPGCVVIAGTHTMEETCVNQCGALGVAVNPDQVGVALCPVLLPDGGVATIHKSHPSRWEIASFEPGTLWTHISLSVGERSVLLLTEVCIDFLAEPRRWAGTLSDADLLESALVIHAVPARTPKSGVGDFIRQATDYVKRRGHVVMFANDADGGGSRIFFENPMGEQPLQDALGSWEFERRGEGVLVVDLYPDRLEPRGRFSRIPTPQPAIVQKAVAPIYYSGLDRGDLLIRRLQATTAGGIRALMQEPLPATQALRAAGTLGRKLRLLHDRAPHLRDADLKMLAEAIVLSPETPSPVEWKYVALFASAETLRQVSTAGPETELCHELAVSQRQAAMQLAREDQLGFALPQVASLVGTIGLLDMPTGVSTRVLAAPSSGGVDTALATWVRDALSRDPSLGNVASRVAEIVGALRPYPVARLAGRITEVIKASKSGWQAAIETCDRHLDSKSRGIENLFRHALEGDVLVPGDHVLLYGYSGATLGYLRKLAARGAARDYTVAVAECKNRVDYDSAPQQIEQLVELGYVVRFVAVTSLARYLADGEVTKVLMGANAVCPDGIVNTMGSRMVALLAQSFGQTLTSFASSYKFYKANEWVSQKEDVGTIQRPEDGLLPYWVTSLVGVRVVNYAYDIVPFPLVARLVTDRGCLSGAGVTDLGEHS